MYIYLQDERATFLKSFKQSSVVRREEIERHVSDTDKPALPPPLPPLSSPATRRPIRHSSSLSSAPDYSCPDMLTQQQQGQHSDVYNRLGTCGNSAIPSAFSYHAKISTPPCLVVPDRSKRCAAAEKEAERLIGRRFRGLYNGGSCGNAGVSRSICSSRRSFDQMRIRERGKAAKKASEIRWRNRHAKRAMHESDVFKRCTDASERSFGAERCYGVTSLLGCHTSPRFSLL